MPKTTPLPTPAIVVLILLSAATHGDTGPCEKVSPNFWMLDNSRCGDMGIGCVGKLEIDWQARRCMNQDEVECISDFTVPLATFTYPAPTALSATTGKCLFANWKKRDGLMRPINRYDCVLDYTKSADLPGGMDCR